MGENLNSAVNNRSRTVKIAICMLGQNPELKTLCNSAYSSPRGCFGWVQSYIAEAEAQRRRGAEAEVELYELTGQPDL